MLSKDRLKAFIPTLDAARAKEFYGQKLGLTLISDDGFGMEFEANGTLLRVSIVEEFSPYPFTVLGWVVTDMRTKVTELTEGGVVFERFPYFEQDELGIWTAPGGTKVAWFKDPDSNLLSVND